MAFVIYILFISFLVFSVSDIPDKLIFAVIHFRHGARAPQAIDIIWMYLEKSGQILEN